MKRIVKKIMSSMAVAALMIATVGCGSKTESSTENLSVAAETEIIKSESTDENTTSEAVTETSSETVTESANVDAINKTLVLYFSATGTTKGVAEKIASVSGADLYEIVPKDPYTDADLNYSDSSTRATMEQNDPDARPEFEPIEIDIDNTYSTVFLGYPIWWGQEPRIMDTFVESYDLSDITVIPFCTSGSSGIGSSGKSLSEKAGSGRWLEGNRFSGTVTEDEIRNWIAGLDI